MYYTASTSTVRGDVMKHKHADLIHAWADGAEIQCRRSVISEWENEVNPGWYYNLEYRIKPEEKKPVVRWLWAYQENNEWFATSSLCTDEEVKNLDWIHFPIKLEWSRTEFPE